MMALPLGEAGAHETVADSSLGRALTLVGGVGVPAGMTALDGSLGGLVPMAFVAVTVRV